MCGWKKQDLLDRDFSTKQGVLKLYSPYVGYHRDRYYSPSQINLLLSTLGWYTDNKYHAI